MTSLVFKINRLFNNEKHINAESYNRKISKTCHKNENGQALRQPLQAQSFFSRTIGDQK